MKTSAAHAQKITPAYEITEAFPEIRLEARVKALETRFDDFSENAAWLFRSLKEKIDVLEGPNIQKREEYDNIHQKT